MAREGEHNAQLKVQGDAQSADKEMRQLATRMGQFEHSVEQSNAALARHTQRQKQVEDGARGMEGKIAGLRDRFVGAAGLAAGVMAAAMTVDHFAARARDLAGATVNLSYDLTALAAAVDNGATKFDLAATATVIQSSALGLSQKQLEEYAAKVDRVADAHRVDLVPALDATTDAILKGRAGALQSMGIQVDFNRALEEEADRLGVTTKQLSLAQEQTTRYREVMRAFNKDLQVNANEADGLGFSWEKTTNQLRDAADNLALAVNNLPGALKTLRVELGLLDEGVGDVTDAVEESEPFVVRWYKGWFGGLSPAQGEDWLPVRAVNALGEAIDDLTLKTANPSLAGAMDNLIAGAKQIEILTAARASLAAQQRTLAEAKVLASLQAVEVQDTEANARADRKRSRGGGRRGPTIRTEEAFAFTPDDIDEMQGGMRAEREALTEHADDYLERWSDFQQRKADLQLESDLQRLAMRQEMDEFREPWERLDPGEAIALERDAQLVHIDNLRRMTDDEVELERLKNRERLVYHQAHVKRLEVERQAELKKWRTTAEVASAINQITQGGLQTGAMATDLFIQNEQRREKARYVTGAVSALVTGIEQQVQAIAAFASFNYVQGALHQAAAIFAFAQSGMLFAKAGGAGGGSRGVSAGSFGASGGGAANGPANGSGGEGLQNQIQSDVPPSQAPTSRGPQRGGAQQQQGSVVFMGPVHLYGTPQGEFVDGMARALETRGRNTRRAV